MKHNIFSRSSSPTQHDPEDGATTFPLNVVSSRPNHTESPNRTLESSAIPL